jgi:tight adherence protein B
VSGSLAFAIASLCLIAGGVLVALLVAARSRSAELKRFTALLTLQPQGPLGTAQPGPAQQAAALPMALTYRLHRAGWAPTSKQVLLVVFVFAVAVVAAWVAAGWFAAGLAAITLLLVAVAVLEFRAQRRMRLLSDSMLGFLERVRQLLSVGNSLSTALARAVDNSPAIVTQCLSPTIRRINNGTGVAESLERCAIELDVYELHLLATAARTNLRFGGSMTAILKNIIENIRKRATVERELRADTTQIRSSAWVLALLPMLVASVVMLMNTDYARWFLVTTTGHKMIAYAVVSQLIGAWLMRLITRTRY